MPVRTKTGKVTAAVDDTIMNLDLKLYKASSKGNLPAVEDLLTWKANANAMSGEYGATPIQVAANNGHKNIVEYLLVYGRADPNCGRPNSMTYRYPYSPLYCASR